MGTFAFRSGGDYAMGAVFTSPAWDANVLRARLYANGFRDIEIMLADEAGSPSYRYVGAPAATHIVLARSSFDGRIDVGEPVIAVQNIDGHRLVEEDEDMRYTFVAGQLYSFGARLSTWERPLLVGKLMAAGFRDVDTMPREDAAPELTVGRNAEDFDHVGVMAAKKSGPVDLDPKIVWVNELDADVDDEDDDEDDDDPTPGMPGWMPEPAGGWAPNPNGTVKLAGGWEAFLLVAPFMTQEDIDALNDLGDEYFRRGEAEVTKYPSCAKHLGGTAGTSSILEFSPSAPVELTVGSPVGKRGHKLIAGCQRDPNEGPGMSTTTKLVIGGLVVGGLLFALTSGD